MKKALYGTTALVSMALVSGTVAADEKMKVGIAGYHQQWVTYTQEENNCTAFNTCANSTTPKLTGFDVKTNSEIWFKGSKKLDNGITVGIDVQLEGLSQGDGDTIDEQYLYVQSDSLGKLILGDENNAAYLLHSWPTNGGVSVSSGDVINVAAYRAPRVTPRHARGGVGNLASYYNTALGTVAPRVTENDTTKITYLSPVFAGFQAGVSYWPEGTQDDNGRTSRLDTTHDGFAFGAKYAGKFSGVGIGASYGYVASGTVPGNSAMFVARGIDEDVEQHSIGLKVSVAGFTGTANYSVVNDGLLTSMTTYDSSSWTISGSYKTGPYTVGVQWFSGEAEDNVVNPADDEHNVLMISGGYQLGAGVRLVAGFYTFDDNDESTASAAQNDGWGLMMGVKTSF